jgi:lipopolysaccharide/colanic/teichoic acid biosynthesis glycosyltransferase
LRDLVLSVPPGITDWASIQFKDENDLLGTACDPERTYVEEVLPVKLGYYVRYVRERNFIVDLKIIVATLLAVAVSTKKKKKRRADKTARQNISR